MKITVIHGQNHKGSTYNAAKMLYDRLGGEVTEFFLPRDFNSFVLTRYIRQYLFFIRYLCHKRDCNKHKNYH